MDGASIGTAPVEDVTDDSHVQINGLDDFDISDFDLEETLNEHISSSTFVRFENRIDGMHLSKVWKTDKRATNREIDVANQICVRSEDPGRSREHNTSDRILRHDRTYYHFFMDAFFATRKYEKSTRRKMCCQLFMIEKSFADAEPLRKRDNFIHALKSFAK